MIDKNEVRRLVRRTNGISGWFSAGAASVFAVLNQVQLENNIEGNLFEIGVHHGKSAVFLAYLRNSESETLGVCDVFERQHLNPSSSGSGDEQLMMANFRSHFSETDNFLRVYSKLSSSLDSSETTDNCRLFHIDGGHSVEEATSDLELAASALHENGAIIIDDAFHPDWPGVTEAIVHFLNKHKEYAPLIAAFGKLTIVPKASLMIYRPAFQRNGIYHLFIPEPALNPELKTFVQSEMFTVPSYRQKIVQSWLYEKKISSRWASSALSVIRTIKSMIRR